MQKCHTLRFDLDIPDEWADRSMITWVAPPSPKYKVLPNILCSSAQIQGAEDLDKFVNRQLKELMGQVKNFDLISRQKTMFGGVPAVELVFCMRPQGIMLQQRQIFFCPDLNDRTVYTVVATSAREDSETMAPVFEQILSSISWND